MKTIIANSVDDFADMAIEREVLRDFDIEYVASHGVDSAESRAILKNADVLIVALQRVTGELMDAMPKCRLVSRLGVGIDTIDVAACTERGVWVANVPDYGVDEVATHAIALLMSLARGIPPLAAKTKTGSWESGMVRPIHRLAGQTLGVIGFGRIGRTAGSKGAGLGLRVIAFDPYLSDAQIREGGAEPVSKEELFRRSDYITLHSPLSPETEKIVNAGTLALMKPTAYLVNTARGGLVDEAALLDALNKGTIRGAGLDVLTAEPPAADNALLQALQRHERTIVTPHIAWYSEEARVDMRRKAAEDIARVLRGERPRTPVNEVGPGGRKGPAHA